MLRHRVFEVLAVALALAASAWVLTRPDHDARKPVAPSDAPDVAADEGNEAKPDAPNDVPPPEHLAGAALPRPGFVLGVDVDPMFARVVRLLRRSTLRGYEWRTADDSDRSLTVVVLQDGPYRYSAGAEVRIEPEGLPPIVGTTDDQGQFRVKELKNVGTVVRVSAPGRFPIVVHGVKPGWLVATLMAPTDREVRVVDARDDAPIAGARVRMLPPTAPSEDLDPYADGTTDADGRLTLTVPRTLRARYVVVAPDRRRAEVSIDDSSPIQTIRVAHGTTLVGRVFGTDARPCDHGTVHVDLVKDGRVEHVASIPVFDDGTFYLDGLDPGGTYEVHVEADDLSRSETIRVVGRSVPMLVSKSIRLSPPGSLVVDLIDETGAAITDARVTLDQNIYGPDLTASKYGRYLFHPIPIGPHRLHVETSLGPTHDEPVTVTSGPNLVTVQIDSGVRVDGVVTDSKGVPVERARVLIERIGADGAVAEARNSSTDARGQFAFGGVTVGGWRASAAAAHAVTIDPVEFRAPARGLRLKLSRLGRAKVRLVHDAGGPVEGDVDIRRSRPDGEVLHGSGTATHGILVIEGFDGQPETLEITAAGYAPATKDVRVPAEGETDLGVMVLKSGHTLAGIVVGANGLPVRGATLLVGHHGRVSSDKRGRFEFAGVPVGPLELVIVAEDYLDKTLVIDGAAGSSLRIELSSGARFHGVVVGADGKPAGGVVLAFIPTDGSTLGEPAAGLRTDEDGTFDVRVPPGRYHIEAKDEGDAKSVLLSDVTVAEGEERKPTWVFRPR